MKKLIFLLLFIVCIGCTKDEESIATITFKVDLVGHPITRVSDSEIYSALQQCMPTIYPLDITNINTNRQYTCNSNESINLPYGEYEIKLHHIDHLAPKFYTGSQWYYDDWIISTCDNIYCSTHPSQGSSGASRFFCGPSISLKDTVVINSNSVINLQSKLTCGALIWNNNEIESISFANKVKRCFGDICIVFFQIREDRFPLQFTLTPRSEFDLIETSYVIKKNDITYGYWYFVKCNSSERNNYMVNINNQNWQKGTL